jgi:hypothetical protein
VRWIVVAVALSGACRLGFDHVGATGDPAFGDAVVVRDASTLEVEAIAWYRMEALEDVGPLRQVVDSTGNAHHARCAPVLCPALVPGRGGTVARFAGASELRVTGTPALQTPSGGTVAAWVKIEDEGCVVQKLVGGGVYNSWQLCVYADSRIVFFTTGPGGPDFLDSPGPLVHGTWYHLALTWNGTRKQLVIDGVLAVVSDAELEFDHRDVVIGRDYNNGAPEFPFHGELDDILIFDRELDLTEIGELVAR